MYRIYTHPQHNNGGLEVTILGCPRSGLPAIDFRQQHHLPLHPDNRLLLSLDLHSESLVRRFSRLAGKEADLQLSAQRYQQVRSGEGVIALPVEPAFAPELLAELLQKPTSESAVARFIEAAVSVVEAHQREQAAAEQLAKAEREAKRAEEYRRSLEWMQGVALGDLVENRFRDDAKVNYYLIQTRGCGLSEAEKDTLKERVSAQIALDRAQETQRLTPFFTALERAMQQRGKLCLGTVRRRLSEESIAQLATTLPSGHTILREKHDIKDCPSSADFQKLLALEELLGLSGAVDEGNEAYTRGFAFTCLTSDRRKLPIVVYDAADKIAEQKGSPEDEE